MIKFLDLHAQYETIKADIDAVVKNVIEESAFIGGKYVQQFEKEFAEYQETPYCIGVGNGTDALEIVLEALNLPKESEIIVPANSFIASAEAVTRTGHKVVFCDCDEENYTISIESLKSKITQATSAVIAVHLYGHPCDMDEILLLAKENNLKVIEDCAQAHGARYKGKKVGGFGDAGTFSFYPGKNLGAYGDGGAIVTKDEALAKKCRMIANHGRLEKYNHLFEGRNSRLDGLQAAILSVKLKYLDEWIQRRVEIADYYSRELARVDEVIVPKRAQWADAVFHLFVIRTEQRDGLQAFLKEHEIQTGIHYPIALPKLDAYRYLGEADALFRANQFDHTYLSLPIGEHMSVDDAQKVASAIKGYFRCE